MLGLLFLTVSPAIYTKLLAVAFVPTVNPGPEPNISAGSTGATIADLRYHHAVATNIFTEYENTEKALRQLLLESTDELYVQYLCHQYIGYVKTTAHALLNHSYTTYANISASALQENGTRLQAPYDINQPFETLLDQVKNAVDYASSGDTPYTPTQIITISFQLLFHTRIFND